MDSEKLNIGDIKIKEIEKKKKIQNEHGDLFQVSNNIYQTMNIKIAVLLFFIYIILNLDIFIDNVLSKVFLNVYDTNTDKITSKGIIINGMIISVIYILLDMLDKKNIL
jgi:hypothetical protein